MIIELSNEQVDTLLGDMLKSNKLSTTGTSDLLEFVFIDDENLYQPMTVRSKDGEFDTDDFDFDINK